jgi:hypothetical protein
MPLDLGNHPARLAPASGLIAEVRMEPAHMVRRSSDRTLEQIADPVSDAITYRMRPATLARSA